MHLHSAVKCPINTSLNKDSSSLGQEADFPATLVSSCHHGERFDDGLDVEEIKCSAAERTGVWSHHEYSCDGNFSQISVYYKKV